MSNPFRPLSNGNAPQIVKLDVNTTLSGNVELDFGQPMPARFTLPPTLARQLAQLLTVAADKAEGRIVTAERVTT